MRFHFKLDGLSSQHQDDLMTIESAMTPRLAYAIFTVKTTGLMAHKDVEGAYEHLKTKLSPYHLTALEELLEVAEMDLAKLARLVKNVPVVMSKRPPVVTLCRLTGSP